MRVLIAPESFDGTLTAWQAAEAMAEGWRETAPADELTLAPLSDGDTGFLHVLEEALGGITVGVTVSDPLGREVPAVVLLHERDGVRSAYIEAAQAAGVHLLGADERNPLVTSSYGVGRLVEVALAEGADRIVVGLGGTATNDAGAGLLAALGAGEAPPLSGGGGPLAELGPDALAGLPDLRRRLAGVELVTACDDDLPLLGLQGTSAATAGGKGATPEQAQRLEGSLGHFTDVVHRVLPVQNDLLTGLPRRLDREPGAGAGGGLGYALYLLGGHRESCVDLVLRAWDVDGLVRRHDLVLTGEGSFDWTSLRRSVVVGVAAAAATYGRPTVVLAGQVQVGRRETMATGVAAAYAVAERPAQVVEAMADPVGTLRRRTARLARTWSPRPGA